MRETWVSFFLVFSISNCGKSEVSWLTATKSKISMNVSLLPAKKGENFNLSSKSANFPLRFLREAASDSLTKGSDLLLALNW